MLSKNNMIPFDEVFPQTKGVKIETERDAIKLAHRVAAALRKESEELAKEQQNSLSSRFFSQST